MSSTSLADIRSTFLEFFRSHSHAVVPSAPLVPQDDPSLLFVNAGMAPFKNVFTGLERPVSPRATSSQKCVRAGGKHNDLDNVGYTARHHTFFEMLGNFSFGDYFKAEAIELAWSLITREFGLPKDRLLVTVFAEDTDAAQLWRKIAGLQDDRIIPIATSDNFWSMGDTGPCGPCSEIFYDHGEVVPGGPPGSPDEDGDRFIEIWNLVFMQFEQKAGGERTPLPKPSIDTGMGLERIAAVLQGVHNNYDVDLFRGLIAQSEAVIGARAEGAGLASHRVIADHLRTSGFLIADGVGPSNEGRGYVLRRIMRRAMRHAHQLGADKPVMAALVPALVEQMGAAYPELGRAQAVIEATLEQEEERFLRTLGRGLALLDAATVDLGPGDALPGETAFKLYDTYGFPLDLTEDALRGRGQRVDVAGFDAAMARQKADARAHWAGSGDQSLGEVWAELRRTLGATLFTGYDQHEGEGVVVGLVSPEGLRESAGPGDTVAVVLDQTPFYAESGGQIGDTGALRFGADGAARVTDTQKRAGDLHALEAEIRSGVLRVGDRVRGAIDVERRAAVRANHSATHLLHAALRRTLGPHVAQKGSYVGPDRLRFDFAHGQSLTRAEIAAIETEVNAVIRQNAPAQTQTMSPEAAAEAGAMALFGEKYGDAVRVLSMGATPEDLARVYSMELCGGVHVAQTGEIALFKIVSESAVAAGVRRIEALTGEAARRALEDQAEALRDIADALKSPVAEAPARVTALLEDRKSLQKELSEARRQLALGMGGGAAPAGPEDIDGVKFLGRVVDNVNPKDLRGLVDDGRAQLGSGVAVFVATNVGKGAACVGVTEDLTARISAVDLVRVAAAAMGGKGGGGRVDLAQAGGPEGDKAQAALDAVREALRSTATASDAA